MASLTVSFTRIFNSLKSPVARPSDTAFLNCSPKLELKLRKKVTILKNALDSSNQSLKEMEIANDNLKHMLRLAEDEVRRLRGEYSDS